MVSVSSAKRVASTQQAAMPNRAEIANVSIGRRRLIATSMAAIRPSGPARASVSARRSGTGELIPFPASDSIVGWWAGSVLAAPSLHRR